MTRTAARLTVDMDLAEAMTATAVPVGAAALDRRTAVGRVTPRDTTRRGRPRGRARGALAASHRAPTGGERTQTGYG